MPGVLVSWGTTTCRLFIRPEAIALRQAFNLAAAGQTRAAVGRVQQAINGLEDPAARGWLMQQKAAYLHMTEPAAARGLLASAIRENPYVLRPAAGSPVAAKPAAAQARAAAEFLASKYQNAMFLVLGIKSLLDEIQWDKDRTDEAEAAWARLGQHLGFASTRPEKQYGTGPDNLWVLGADRHAVTDLKTGCTTSTIDKHDLDQLGGSVRWDQQHFPGVTSLPVMVHPQPRLP